MTSGRRWEMCVAPSASRWLGQDPAREAGATRSALAYVSNRFGTFLYGRVDTVAIAGGKAVHEQMQVARSLLLGIERCHKLLWRSQAP